MCACFEDDEGRQGGGGGVVVYHDGLLERPKLVGMIDFAGSLRL